MEIRAIQNSDFAPVKNLLRRAFANEPHSDQTEHLLVERLRLSAAYVPELEFVAIEDTLVVGYILLTKIYIQNKNEKHTVLALAPIAVLPEFQNKKIGSKLMEVAHQKTIDMGFNAIILLGNPSYYKKFGYQKASQYEIQSPFDVPEEYFMAKELISKSIENCKGIATYPKEFYG